jgi:pimeloyl-ACP methyl ester carboxylesterase
MIRIAWMVALTVFAVIASAAVIGLGYCDVRRRKIAKALAFRTPNPIHESMFAKIGGIAQWVQIRGENRDNPVVLLVHGGPGVSYVPFTPTFRSWETAFTIVQWDQRGAGKTYGRSGKAERGAMTIARMVQDGIEVAEFVCKRLNKEKIVLFSHSWGTLLGVSMVDRRPDLFYAYVGTGQHVSMEISEPVSYDMVLKKARASGNRKVVKRLEAIGPPPYRDMKTWMIK